MTGRDETEEVAKGLEQVVMDAAIKAVVDDLPHFRGADKKETD